MLVVTADTMREMDRRSMAEGGMPGIALMENAGAAAAEAATRMLGRKSGALVHVICGPGNNGGDGFCAARRLAVAGHNVTLELTADPDRLRGDALIQYRALAASTARIARPTRTPDLVLDCVLGTGATGAPHGAAAEAIEAMAAWGAPILAVDLPSGLDATSGSAPGPAVRASRTVTFGAMKLGMLLGCGPDLCGAVDVNPIGCDWAGYGAGSPYSLVDQEVAARCWPPRSRTAHKGSFGHVIVLGGSAGMLGAPILAGHAALRSGAGLVTVGTPAAGAASVIGACPALMAAPLPDADGSLDEHAAEAIDDRHSAIALGPGLGRSEAAERLVRVVVTTAGAPLVLDADGLYALGRSPQPRPARPCAMTPHHGEAARLLGATAEAVAADPLTAVRAVATLYRVVALLKGGPTLVCDGRATDGEAPVAIVNTGTPALATAGTGDVLTGIVASLLARGCDPWDAARAAAWAHGTAGRRAAKRLGSEGVTAPDVIDRLTETLARLERMEA
jgi:NAD(P)H-hydrate epimerase